ncbi:hypothetical protein NOSIN_00085 [Nocardiopsis sinuspersici]|uniref:Uncharacterized protein n=1 Tax=Nocardiopsis sinuspersici TaxID=501010 RepID=A0A1V3BVJ8_9ACTN|nr:hypothetical protein NOSIN_00085 [Nocardiopsis sinuspersici]
MHPALTPLVADVHEVLTCAGLLASEELPPPARHRAGYALIPVGDFKLAIRWSMLERDYGTLACDRRREVMVNAMATLLGDAGYAVEHTGSVLEGPHLRVDLFTSPERVQHAVRATRWEGDTDVPWPDSGAAQGCGSQRQPA